MTEAGLLHDLLEETKIKISLYDGNIWFHFTQLPQIARLLLLQKKTPSNLLRTQRPGMHNDAFTLGVII